MTTHETDDPARRDLLQGIKEEHAKYTNTGYSNNEDLWTLLSDTYFLLTGHALI